MEFPLPTDFEQTELTSTSRPVPSESEHKDIEPTLHPIYDEIVVKQPPIGNAFTTYGPLAIRPDLVSFQDAMSRPDHES